MNQYLHALNIVSHNSYKTLQRLWGYFHSWEYVWKKAQYNEMLKSGVTEAFIGKLQYARKTLDIEASLQILKKASIQMIEPDSVEFLEPLRHIPQAPFSLYRKGAPLSPQGNTIAIVGTRKPSTYGRKATEQITKTFVNNNFTVVSGLAFGIDALAHHMAVESKKPTIAILASGLDIISPSYHEKLADQIIATGGTLLSEYVPGSSALAHRFLERNRLISGLCKSTIVIEAQTKSGALITARHALEQNRDVYALVGDIYRPQAQGCLRLIAEDAARPIAVLENFYRDFGIEQHRTQTQQFDGLTQKIYNLLQEKPHTVQNLNSQLTVPIAKIIVAITQLEMEGLAQRDLQGVWHPK